MLPITIIVIVVVTILTVVIFGLAWLAYSSCLKAYKAEVSQGKHDAQITKELLNKKSKKQVVVKVLSFTMTFILILLLVSLFITALVFKAQGEIFSINNTSALVIKSSSMSQFYNDELSIKYKELNYNPDFQFDIGDICLFEKVDTSSLTLGEVYGYKYKNIIITHRLVGTYINDTGEVFYIFRGDNNPSKDQILVPADNIIYHYTDHKILGIGSFILYAQSPLGIWSLICIMGIIVSSDIVLHKIKKIQKQRYIEIGGTNND